MSQSGVYVESFSFMGLVSQFFFERKRGLDMKKNHVLTEQEMLLREIAEAKFELERVRTLFNYADAEHFEIANAELTIAENKYNLLFKKARMLDMKGCHFCNFIAAYC